MMRDELEQAIEAACTPRPRDRALMDRTGAPAANEKTRGRFLDRLRIFLAEAPQDLTLQEILEDLEA